MTIPALPYDTRTITYSPAVPTASFDLPFPVFGDGGDIEVKVNDTDLIYGPDYSILSHSGLPWSSIPSPVGDAYILLTVPVTGSVVINGKMLTRRVSQASAPFNIDDFNRAFTEACANRQEFRRDIETILAQLAAGSAIYNDDPSGFIDVLASTRGAILYRGPSDWVGRAPGNKGQTLITQGAGADPLWGNNRGLHYDDYLQRYGNDTTALTHAISDLYNGDYRTLHGNGKTVTLLTNFDVAAAAGLTGATISDQKRITDFRFKCDPAWTQPAFAQLFGGVTDATSADITSIADTSGFVVGQMLEHRNLPRFSTVASKTSSKVTIANQWNTPAIASNTAGVIKAANTTSGSKILSNIGGQMGPLSAGKSITGAGVPGGTSIDQIITTFTMSAAATATTNGVNITIVVAGALTRTFSGTADITNGSTAVTVYMDDSFSAHNGDTITGAGIPGGTTLSARSCTSLRMTANATSNNVVANYTFGTAPTDIRAMKYFVGNTTANNEVVTGIASTAGLKIGMLVAGLNIQRCNSIRSIDSATQVTLSFPVWDTVTGKVISYRDDNYLLDFSGFASLEFTSIDHCTFFCNDKGNGLRCAQNQLAMNIHHNWFLDFTYFGFRAWAKFGGAVSLERNRFRGSSATANGAGISQNAICATTAGSDTKTRFNDGETFLYGLVQAQGAGMIIANHFFNTGDTPTFICQNEQANVLVGNYIGTGWIELTNETDAAANTPSVGGTSITGNIFHAGEDPSYAFVVAKPCTPGSSSVKLSGITIAGNSVVVTANTGGESFLTRVDNSLADFDYTDVRGIYVHDNPGTNIKPHENPLRVRKNVTVAATAHVIDVTGLLPFNAQPNYLVSAPALMNASTPGAITNTTINRATRQVTVTTAASTTGDICLEVNCNTQRSPPNAATTSIFADRAMT